jgi:hypothetical protein
MEERVGDRRHRVRLPLQWPVRFQRSEGAQEIGGQTENLSSEGFYCILEEPLDVEERLECSIGIPNVSLVSAASGPELRCAVRVVRVERTLSGARFGVACRIERYMLLPSQNPSSIAPRSGAA